MLLNQDELKQLLNQVWNNESASMDLANYRSGLGSLITIDMVGEDYYYSWINSGKTGLKSNGKFYIML